MSEINHLLSSPFMIRDWGELGMFISDGRQLFDHEQAKQIISALVHTLNRYTPEEYDAVLADYVARRNSEWKQSVQQINNTEQKRRTEPLTFGSGGWYVYLIQEQSQGHYKIGKAKNVQQRLNQLIKLPMIITPIVIIETNDNTRLERQLHRQFADKRVDGEWFKLTDDDVAYIKGLANGS